MQTILMGADPEVALVRNGSIVPCVGLIPGSKKNPYPVEGSAVGLMLQEDNVSLEYNFKPVPIELFAAASDVAISEVKLAVRNLLGNEYDIHLTDAFAFRPEQLQSEQAKAFGCDPDFLAYSRGDMRPALDPKKVGNLRSFAGHIHIGYDRDKCPTPDWAIVQGMEAFCYALQCVNGWDMQPHRRQTYGLPGLYRPKEYGLEYRTPSNFWVQRTKYAVALGTCAEHIINKPSLFQELYHQVNWKQVQAVILNPHAPVSNTLFDDLSEMKERLYSAPSEE